MQIEARRRVLANGLTVVVHEDRTAPVVSVVVYYHVGSSREERGRTGFAHLFEHMLFQGSAHVAESGHFQLIQTAGGTLNGTTNQDRTNYYETLPSEFLELALFLESDRMGFLLPAMTQAKLDNQRDVVMNERRQSYENRPYGLVYENVLSALYPEDHPYSWPTIGSMEDIAAATLADVEAFFERWYGPNNGTLVIAGDVEAERAFELAERWFGAIERGPEVSTPAPRPAGLVETRRLVHEDRVQLPQLTLTWPTVQAWHPDEPALNLLADVLSANSASILDRVLMIEEERASYVTIGHYAAERTGSLTLTLRPTRDATLTALEQRVDELVRELVTTGVQEARLERLKNRMEGATLRGFEGIAARAAMLGHQQCFRGEVDLLPELLKRHRAVTAAEVVDVARRYLVDAPHVVLSTVPHGERALAAGARSTERRAAPAQTARADVPAPAAHGPLPLPAVERAALGAGRGSVLGFSDATLPLVHLALAFPGGRFLEASSESGRASLVAELLLEGTRALASAEFPDVLDGLGATLGIYAGDEEVLVRMTTLERTLERSFELLEDVLYEPRFGQGDVERLVRQRLLGIRTRADRPAVLADDLFQSLVFGPEDARGRTALGAEEALQDVSPADFAALWSRLRGAEGVRVCCAGAAAPARVAALLSRLSLAPAETPAQALPPAPELPQGIRIHLVDKPGAKQSELRLGHACIARDDPDFDLMLAVNHVVGGSFSSRINLNLREDKGWTYGARSSLSGGRAKGAFRVATAVETKRTAPAVAEILGELARIPDGFSADEARFAGEALSRSLRREYAETAARLTYLQNLAKYGFPDDYPSQRLARLERLDARALDAAAARHLQPRRLEVVVVGDAALVRGDLEALGVGPLLDGSALAGLA